MNNDSDDVVFNSYKSIEITFQVDSNSLTLSHHPEVIQFEDCEKILISFKPG